MRIDIALRLNPFSHEAGLETIIPGTATSLKAYPACLLFSDHSNQSTYTVKLDIEGPVKSFTATLELEKNKLKLFGESKRGYFRLIIQPKDGAIHITPDKWFNQHSPTFESIPCTHITARPIEKLALGCNKAQDWNAMVRRNDLLEWLPHWFTLAQWYPQVEDMQFLNYQDLHNTLLANFDGYFVPAAKKGELLGLADYQKDPIKWIAAGAQSIRSFFLSHTEDTLEILKNLPKELIVGRLLHAQLPWGEMDLEWTRGLPRRVIIRSNKDATIQLQLPKEITSFRLTNATTKHKTQLKAGTYLSIEKNSVLYLDNLKK